MNEIGTMGDNCNAYLSLNKEPTDEEKIKALNNYMKSLASYNRSWTCNPAEYIPKIALENELLVSSEESQIEIESTTPLPSITLELEQSELLGRQLVAARFIKAGEVVLIEPPYVIGPMGCQPHCLKCLSLVKADMPCPECGFNFCDSNCLTEDHNQECSDLKLLHLSEKDFSQKGTSFASKLRDRNAIKKIDCGAELEDEKTRKLRALLVKTNTVLQSRKCCVVQKYLLVTTLRTLRKMQDNTDSCNTIMALQANVVTDSPQYESHHKSMVIPITKNICPNINPDLLQRIAAVWDTNCFEVALGTGNRVQGMYPVASLINHKCRANLQQSYSSKGTMIIRATEDIPKGTPLSLWYMNPIWPTRMRRKHLFETKHFECRCDRCNDPNEFKTFMGSFICNDCNSPLLPIDPLDLETDWICSETICKGTMSYMRVAVMDCKLAPMLLKVTGKDLDVVENIVGGLLEKLHPQNHLIIRIYLAAIFYHANMDLTEYSDEHLDILLKSCIVVLNVLIAIEAPLAVKRARVGREYVRCHLEKLRRRKHLEDVSTEAKKLKTEIELATLCLGWSTQAPSMECVITLFKELSME